MKIPSLKRFLYWLRSPGDELRQRVLHGGIWVTFLNITDRILSIVRLIVLARLLSPSDFGLMGIALLTMGVMKKLANLGIDPALVQREEDNIDSYLDTVWVMKIVRATGLFLILVLAAPFVAAFFGEPRAEQVLQVLGIGIILNGLVNPSVVYFRKNLQFHKQFFYKISGAVVDFGVAVATALILQTVWALVYGILAGRLTRMVISYLLSEYRPNFKFDYTAASEILDFGKWVWATGLVLFAATSGDDIFVGWYLTATALGFYQMAFRLSNAPATEVTHVISSVMFPTYSKLQNDQEALRNAFLKTIRVTFVITFPMAVGILLVTPSFIRIILGERWSPMASAMQIMAIAGLFRAIAATGGAIFNGYGIPDWDFRMNIIRVSAIVLTIWPLTDLWGITGAAVSITLGIGMTLPVWLYKTADITNLRLRSYGESLLIPLLGSILMCGPVLFILGSSIWRLAGAIFIGAITYIFSILIMYRYQEESPVDDLVNLIRE